MDADVHNSGDGVVLTVKVVPGSSRTHIAGKLGNMLKIKIAAPPEKGKANKELMQFLATKLRIKSRDVQIQSGQTNSIKQLLIQGASIDHVRSLFPE